MRLLYGEISDTIAEKIPAFVKVVRLGANVKAAALTLLTPEIAGLQSRFVLAQADQLAVFVKSAVGNAVFHRSSSGCVGVINCGT